VHVTCHHLSLKRESMLSASGRQSYQNNVRYISNKVMKASCDFYFYFYFYFYHSAVLVFVGL